MTDMKIAETSDAAADLIEERGLNRNGGAVGPDESLCSIGAISYVNSALLNEAGEALAAVVGVTFGPELVNWSDRWALDQADVVNHFRKAAESVRSGAQS